MASESAALLYRHDIGGGLHHTQCRRVALGVNADFTNIELGKITAPLAVLYLGQRRFDGLSDKLGAIPITLKQVQSHALSRFGAHARQMTQTVDQSGDRRT
jgi:hypothetical protein